MLDHLPVGDSHDIDHSISTSRPVGEMPIQEPVFLPRNVLCAERLEQAVLHRVDRGCRAARYADPEVNVLHVPLGGPR